MTHFEKPESGRGLRPNGCSKGFSGAGIKPRRDIHREHWHGKRIQGFDDCSIKPLHFTFQAGSQDGINDRITLRNPFAIDC